MKYFKSHFWYSKSQRNGILFLLLLILILQAIYWFVDFSLDDFQDANSPEIVSFQRQIDSLKVIEIESRKPKIYPFNPNFITDFKGEQLGMSIEEIDRLHTFRKQQKWINSTTDFKKVTKISDSLLAKISPYFKFPDWVKNRNKKQQYIISSKVEKSHSLYLKNKYKNRKPTTTNINQATAEDLTIVSGIGEKISKRIIKYRSKLQGFSFENQLYEVWGLDKTVADKVLQTFKIIEKPTIEKINVNTATFKQVLRNPYVDYELCKKIFNFRDEVAELQDISELKEIENFPLEKYDRIVLYLEAK